MNMVPIMRFRMQKRTVGESQLATSSAPFMAADATSFICDTVSVLLQRNENEEERERVIKREKELVRKSGGMAVD